MIISPIDQRIRDAGFNYVPFNQFLASPFQIPQGETATDPNTGAGIVTLPMGGGGSGGGALQAGDIDYGSFASAGFDAYANRQPTPLVDETYQSRLNKTFMGFPSYREQQLTPADIGEYIGSGIDIPLELTTAGKIQQGLGGAKEGLAGLAEKFKGIGPVSFILNKMDRFNTLPELDQQFIKQSMGYRGPTVFGENTGGGYVDPFGVNVRSAFGNYAEKVRDDFDKLTEALSPTGAIGGKKDFQGATYNPETGLFESDTLDQKTLDALNKRTNMVRTKLNFRKKQKLQQDFDKKIAEAQKKAEEAAAKEAAARAEAQTIQDRNRREGTGGYQSDFSQDRGFMEGPSGREAFSGDTDLSGTMGSFMDGGIVDMLEIYD